MFIVIDKNKNNILKQFSRDINLQPGKKIHLPRHKMRVLCSDFIKPRFQTDV